MGVGKNNQLEIFLFRALKTKSAEGDRADSTLGKPGSPVFLGSSIGRSIMHCGWLVKGQRLAGSGVYRNRKSLTIRRYHEFGIEPIHRGRRRRDFPMRVYFWYKNCLILTHWILPNVIIRVFDKVAYPPSLLIKLGKFQNIVVHTLLFPRSDGSTIRVMYAPPV